VVPITDDNGMYRLKRTKEPSNLDTLSLMNSDLCNALQFAIMLLVWHLVAVMTVEATNHCAFSLVTVSAKLPTEE
jgi:hypothetical protein